MFEISEEEAPGIKDSSRNQEDKMSSVNSGNC
jgi:hypothetical protein